MLVICFYESLVLQFLYSGDYGSLLLAHTQHDDQCPGFKCPKQSPIQMTASNDFDLTVKLGLVPRIDFGIQAGLNIWGLDVADAFGKVGASFQVYLEAELKDSINSTGFPAFQPLGVKNGAPYVIDSATGQAVKYFFLCNLNHRFEVSSSLCIQL